MNNILITGGTGSFGQAFIRRLFSRGINIPLSAGVSVPHRVVVYSRNEFNQHLMRQSFMEYDRHLRFMIGDIRDRDRLRRALQGVDTVVHAAALKRIEVGHYNPLEMVKTNIGGAENLIEAAMDAGVKKVIALSSDKAFQPVSPYGLSKALAESLFVNANNMRGWDGPIFSVCRYGNVWNSTGSVVPTWKALISGGTKRVPVTDPDCTRFFMKMDEAVDLVIKTYLTMKGGEINVPTLPAYRLGDLAEAMKVEMSVGSLPPWEKMHEFMEEGNSSEYARRMSVDELRAEL